MKDAVKSSLVEAYLEKRDSLKRFLIAQFRDETMAEDILQELYLKIARTNFDSEIQHPGTFLFRMAHNLALDVIKMNARSATRDRDWQEARTQEIGGEPIHDAPDPDTLIDGKKLLDRLKQAILEMPIKRRQVFIAHKLEGLTYAKVAERFGISRSGVEKHMSSALKDILGKLDEDS